MSSIIKDLFLHKKMVESSCGLNSVTLVFCETSDNPNPTLKRLTILFLTLEGKGLLVPCIRRQKFTRIVKAPKRFSCHLELGNLNLCSDHVKKPVYTLAETVYLYKVVAVVIYIFCRFLIKPQNLQQKNKLPC